ncbi:retrovirus-related pol polyprotein from transposon TNT 1-94 [Tanacetum coccineum]
MVLLREKIRTLIEAARTMLADSKLPTTFWANAVNTACYVQNGVLVVKPHNKTPYELFTCRTPFLSFMKPFGCHVTILNTLDHLGKFYGKSDDGFFVGYSLNSKDFRFYSSYATLTATYADFFGDESELDLSNIATTYPVPSTPNTRIHKDHSLDHVIGDMQSGVQTRRMINEQGFISVVYEGKTHEDLHTCLFACFLSQEEPKKVIQALKDLSWIEAMQEELLQFKLQQVWTLVDLPYGKRAIGTKWVYRNKKDERGIVIRNKARLVAQGYTQEEGIDYDEVFAPVARIEAIRLFLAYASFKDFVVYQMDVKSAFVYGKIEKKFMSVNLQDLKIQSSLTKFTRIKSDILLVQVYVDDIIFGSTKKELCTDFENLMHKKFQMSSMGKLTFFLGLQVIQKDDGIFISQDKKSTIGGCQFLGRRLISWQCKKQTIVANSTTEAEHVAAASCCGQSSDFLNGSHIRYALTKNPTIYVSLIEKFWQTATVRIVDNGEQEITATVDGKEFTITEASVRRHLQLADVDGISVLPTTEIFDQLSLMGNMKRGFFGEHTPLFPSMIAIQAEEGEGSGHPSEPQPPPSTAQPTNEEPIPNVVSSSHQKTQTPRQALNKVTELPQTSEPIPNIGRRLKLNKQVYGAAYTKLIKKVKKLEKTVKTSHSRRRAKIVVSDNEEASEDSSKQGRMREKIDQDVGVNLVTHTQGEDKHEDQLGVSCISTAEESVSTAGASMPISTAGMVQEVNINIPSPVVVKDKDQELNLMKSYSWRLQAGKKQTAKVDQAKMLVDLINQRKKYFATQKAEAKRNKPMTQAQQRNYMINYIKHMGSHTLKLEVLKATEENLIHEGSKKQKTNEASGSVQEQPEEEEKELSQEDLQQMMMVGSGFKE